MVKPPFAGVPALAPGEGPQLTGDEASDAALAALWAAEAARAAAIAAANETARAEAEANVAAAWRRWYGANDQPLDENTIIDGERQSPAAAAAARAAAAAAENPTPAFEP